MWTTGADVRVDRDIYDEHLLFLNPGLQRRVYDRFCLSNSLLLRLQKHFAQSATKGSLKVGSFVRGSNSADASERPQRERKLTVQVT